MSSESGQGPDNQNPDSDDPKSKGRNAAEPSTEYFDGFPTVDGDFRSPKFAEDDFPTLNQADIAKASASKKTESSNVDKWLDAWLVDGADGEKDTVGVEGKTLDEPANVKKSETKRSKGKRSVEDEVRPKNIDGVEKANKHKPNSDKASSEGDQSKVGAGQRSIDESGTVGSSPSTIEMPAIKVDQPPVGSEQQVTAGPGSTRAARAAKESESTTSADARQIRRAKLKQEQEQHQDQHAARLNDWHHQVTNPVLTSNLSLSNRKAAPDRSRKLISFAGIFLVLALTGGLIYAVATRNATSETEPVVSAGAAAQSAGEVVELPVGGSAPEGIQKLATSTVRILGLNDGQQVACAGSGVIVEANGTILTNAHVVTSGEGCRFSTLGVAVTTDPSKPAELLYQAEVVAVNGELDLAVIRITDSLDGEPVPDDFTTAQLGNSESVALGDTISILGYPVIGGDTVTFTTGAVSGFSSQSGIGNRAFIKTDATISAGNSGGMAVDANGLVVGIPTKARGSESGPSVDCRAVDDTNDDGVVDDSDLCVSVGGFLNGLRPINLAKPILSEVELGRSLAIPVLEEDSAAATFDMSGVTFEAPRFSLGEKGNVPRRAVVTLSTDAEELCLFVNWSGVPDGTLWDGLWYIDGKLAREHSSFEQRWTFGESGENFWMCVLAENETDESVNGIRPGLYEVGFFLEGQLVFAEGIEVTPEPVETFRVGWSNETKQDLCGLAINPLSKSQQVGLNELYPGVVIKSDEEGFALELPKGTVVVEAYGCDGEVIAGDYEGIEIKGSETFIIGIEEET